MTARWSCAVQVHAGHHAWDSAQSSLVDTARVVLVTDARFAWHAADSANLVRESLHLPGSRVRVLDGATSTAVVEELASWLAAQRADAVVALGGGRIMDTVKLACHHYADPRTLAVLRARGIRAGTAMLPAPEHPLPRRLFVPTTVGTGSEVSMVACLLLAGHNRLITGTGLRPDVAVLDSRFTATLPTPLLAEGVLEALLRVAGAYIGSATESTPLADVSAFTLVRELTGAGDAVARGDTGPDVRLFVAQLSAATHTGWALTGRNPFATKHWYLANELATHLNVRKMTAIAALLPAIWSRIASGDTRYGSAERLAEVWTWIRDACCETLDFDPARGIASLLDHWKIDRPSPADEDCPLTVARRCVDVWGGRLPMLPGLAPQEIAALVAESLASADR